MRILLKRMPHNMNHTKVNKYKSDMGTTAYCNKQCKQQKDYGKQEELSAGKEETPDEYGKDSIILINEPTTAGLFNESTTSI